MSDQNLGKNFEFRILQDWKGYVSSVDPTKLTENAMIKGSLNIYKKLSGTLSVREGMKRRGSANATVSPISSEFVWNTSWGETRVLIVSEGYLQVEYQNIYYNLKAFTPTRFVFDKWWDAVEKKDKLLFVNGTTNLYWWSGGITTIKATTTNTIQKVDNTISWIGAGFSPTGTIIINGNTYTYSGGASTDTLTGVAGDPTGEANGSVVLQQVTTIATTPDTILPNDFIKTIGNRAYIGGYTSRFIYISANDDFTNFTIPTPTIPGSPNLLTLDSNGNGIGVKSGNPWISFGTSEWMEVTFPQHSDATGVIIEQITTNPFPLASQGSAYSHEFIDNSGDNIIYLAKDQQVREIGNFNNLFTTGYPSLSQEINTELGQQDFTGGGIKCIGDFTYLTSPVSGKTYLYQVRQSINDNGNVVAERLWHAPMTWAITRVDEIDGIVYGFSNANPQVYQLWNTEQWHDDSPTDEALPYACILSLAYRTGGRRQGLQQFNRMFSEGYIETGTPLTLTINYNYEGATNILNAPVNSVARPAYTFGGTSNVVGTASSLGDESLGDEPLGDGISDIFIDDLPKFKVINEFSPINCFEYNPVYSSNSADARWELLACGTNAKLAEQESTFIINKA